jgi:cytochrome c-type biogenesis protein
LKEELVRFAPRVARACLAARVQAGVGRKCIRRMALSAVAVIALGCQEAEQFRPLAVGDPAPAYAARELSGADVSLVDLRGQVVLLNVWATWCVPCQEEMPALQRLYSEMKDRGLVVLAVSVDQAGANEAVTRFTEELGIDFRVALDPALEVQRAFRTIGVPESFLIDREGRIAHRWVGPFDPQASEVRALLSEALDG